jgi:hypothetical protein
MYFPNHKSKKAILVYRINKIGGFFTNFIKRFTTGNK